MKVLILTTSYPPAIGGLETVAELLARRFGEMGHTVVVACSDEVGGSFKEPVVECPRMYWKPSKTALIRLARDADVVLHNNISLRMGVWAAIGNRRTVVAVHTWLINKHGKIGFREYAKLVFLKIIAHRVICASDELAESLPMRSQVVQNGYRDDVFICPVEVCARDSYFLWVV